MTVIKEYNWRKEPALQHEKPENSIFSFTVSIKESLLIFNIVILLFS
nr:MAG TPA: hypothetical protein [Caudoviricetes sp.]